MFNSAVAAALDRVWVFIVCAELLCSGAGRGILFFLTWPMGFWAEMAPQSLAWKSGLILWADPWDMVALMALPAPLCLSLSIRR